MKKTCCFTGHRPEKLNGYNPKDNSDLLWRLRDEIVRLIEQDGVDTFISGMAIGVDQWAARIVLKLRNTSHPHIRLIAAIPCLNHHKKWPRSSRDEWVEITEAADIVHYVTTEEYSRSCMQVRNVWMCNQSDVAIAVWDGTPGGTGNCVEYANKIQLPVIPIDPKVYRK